MRLPRYWTAAGDGGSAARQLGVLGLSGDVFLDLIALMLA